MGKIAFVSFNTGGTLGHLTLLSKMASSLNRVADIHILSEHEYESYSSVSDPNIKWFKFKEQNHLSSIGGEIKHSSSPEILGYILQNGIDTTIYSTFFDPDLIGGLADHNVRNIYVSYPLRDSFSELFFLREQDCLFDRVIILGDLYDNDYPASVTRSRPLFSEQQREENTPSNILLTCGGGGRPSSRQFLDLMKDYIPLIKQKHNPDILLVTGPNNKGFHMEGVTCVSHANDMLEQMDSARLVISEAGYFSTHELISRTRPSILIPGARRIDNQELRAVEYAKRGLGFCFMPEEDISDLVSRSMELLTDEQQYLVFRENNRRYYNQQNKGNSLGKILMNSLK
ncbi:MAG: glycosyltransferase [Nanoarchaeota archaeon]